MVALAALAILACCTACSKPISEAPRAAATAKGSKVRVQELREREGALRSYFEPMTQLPWLDASGADPYRIVARPDEHGFVGILRGARALVTLDTELRELARAAVAESPTALCVAAGQAFVASRYSSEIARFSWGSGGAIAALTPLRVAASGVADLACGERGMVYVLPADGSDLLTLDARGQVLDRRPAQRGGLRLLRRGRYLLESSLFERTLRVLGLSERGTPTRELTRIQHDGPLWGFDALEHGQELLIAVAGAEDKPLVRAHGEFENIDSFVWLYRWGSVLEQLSALDVGEQGLVVPKAVALTDTADGLLLSVLGAGSGRALWARWSQDLRAVPRLQVERVPPGASDAVFESQGAGRVSYASPLLDAWVRVDSAGARIERVDAETRPEPRVRLGEALFFTDLMAPLNSSAGTHSRFSCETCHFEGGVDGRVHYTGRADVSVVTKPLFGLANNRPHFSRALDPDLSSVCHNEFRVAGAGSGQDPWFSLTVADYPWLKELGIAAGQLSALELREALLDFLYAFSHAPNARSLGRRQFSELEAAGAQAFREHCSSCHAPRLFSDDATSSAGFEAWQDLIFRRNAPLVWARGDYAKTGILPYVQERGTRITSLRRLFLKPRYFTNGSAATLEAVLERFREGPSGSWHEAPPEPELAQLSPGARQALLSFLQLL